MALRHGVLAVAVEQALATAVPAASGRQAEKIFRAPGRDSTAVVDMFETSGMTSGPLPSVARWPWAAPSVPTVQHIIQTISPGHQVLPIQTRVLEYHGHFERVVLGADARAFVSSKKEISVAGPQSRDARSWTHRAGHLHVSGRRFRFLIIRHDFESSALHCRTMGSCLGFDRDRK